MCRSQSCCHAGGGWDVGAPAKGAGVFLAAVLAGYEALAHAGVLLAAVAGVALGTAALTAGAMWWLWPRRLEPGPARAAVRLVPVVTSVFKAPAQTLNTAPPNVRELEQRAPLALEAMGDECVICDGRNGNHSPWCGKAAECPVPLAGRPRAAGGARRGRPAEKPRDKQRPAPIDKGAGKGGRVDHKIWTTMDKAEWGDGPWQGEPDKEQWQDEATGYACLIKRNRAGALCGYVGVPEGHPWHGSGYGDVDPGVHGGLTYAGLCQDGPEAETICHVPAPGEPEPLWWLGFDCAHAFDLSPARAAREAARGWGRIGDETYRTAAYVKAECASLAAQAAKAVVPGVVLRGAGKAAGR